MVIVVKECFTTYLARLYLCYSLIPVIGLYAHCLYLGINVGHKTDIGDYYAALQLGFFISLAHAVSFIPLANLFVAEKTNPKIALTFCAISFLVEGSGLCILWMLLSAGFRGVDGMPGEAIPLLMYFFLYLPGRFVFMLIAYSIVTLERRTSKVSKYPKTVLDDAQDAQQKNEI
jgi:hypothetical protein